MKRKGKKKTLTADCKAEFKAIRQKIQRDYELIEKKGWSVALRWWGQDGRTALQYAAETSQMSDRLHQSGHDVHHADWQEALNVVKTATAAAQHTQDANCVTPVSAPTVSKYMRAQDLAEGSSRTTTGTTSSLTQTVVREAAAKSLRAVVCYVITMLYAGYNPIDSDHPRYLKHKLTMNDTDRLVESVTKCAMLPVDNHLLTSQDATTTYVHLNAQPSKTDVGQRKANARSQAPQDIDEEPVELSAEETARLSAAMATRLAELQAATPETDLDQALLQKNRPAAPATASDGAPLRPCDGHHTSAVVQERRAKERGDAFNGKGIKVKSMLISNPAGHMGPFWECVTVTGT
jgi:hypothetical protein